MHGVPRLVPSWDGGILHVPRVTQGLKLVKPLGSISRIPRESQPGTANSVQSQRARWQMQNDADKTFKLFFFPITLHSGWFGSYPKIGLFFWKRRPCCPIGARWLLQFRGSWWAVFSFELHRNCRYPDKPISVGIWIRNELLRSNLGVPLQTFTFLGRKYKKSQIHTYQCFQDLSNSGRRGTAGHSIPMLWAYACELLPIAATCLQMQRVQL